MHLKKNRRVSDVYFSGGFFHHIANEKKGTKTSVNISFTKDGKNWFIPAYYSCPKGIVTDICVETDFGEYTSFLKGFYDADGNPRADLTDEEYRLQEQNNPLNHHFETRLLRNKKTILFNQMQAIVYVPDNIDNKEALRLVKHYKLNQNSCWSFYRVSFPCNTRNTPRSLAIKLCAVYDFITAAKFRIAPGEKTEIIHPVTKTVYALEALSLTDESFSFGDPNYKIPSHYKMLRYSLTPAPVNIDYFVRDTKNSDAIKLTDVRYDYLPAASQSVAVIGGADGPSVLFSAPKTPEKCIHTVCSALHFEPVKDVKWKFIFMIKTKEDKTITIKGSRDDVWPSWKDNSTEISTIY